MKLYLYIVFLAMLFQFKLSLFGQSAAPECLPGRFYLMGSRDIHALRLVNNTIQYDGVVATSASNDGFSALAIANLDGTNKFYASTDSGIVRLDNDWRLIYRGEGQGFPNGGGKDSNLFFDAFSASGGAIYKFNGTSIQMVVPKFNLGVADMTVDDDGNLYFFDRPGVGDQVDLKVIAPDGNLLVSYPINLNPSNAYGVMMMGNVLYVAMGSQGAFPNSLLPITLTERNATIGKAIPLPPEASQFSFIDMASCASAKVPFICLKGPAAPTVKVLQPDCINSTGSCELIAPVSSNILYSFNNTDYSNQRNWQLLKPGNYSVTAQDTSIKCISRPTDVYIAPQPITPAAPELSITQPACPVITGTIKVNTNGLTGMRYSINGGAYTNSSGVFDNLVPGTYAVSASNGNCNSAATITVVNPMVALQLSLTASSAIAEIGKPLTLSVTGNIEFSVVGWEPAALFTNQTAITQNITIHNTSQFYVIGKTPGNCLDTASVRIITNAPSSIFIPNAFSPNQDGRNDIFYVYGSGIRQFKLSIFNRFGENVFTSSSQDVGWNGNYKGKPQPLGAYVYILSTIGADNKEMIRKGTIMLVR